MIFENYISDTKPAVDRSFRSYSIVATLQYNLDDERLRLIAAFLLYSIAASGMALPTGTSFLGHRESMRLTVPVVLTSGKSLASDRMFAERIAKVTVGACLSPENWITELCKLSIVLDDGTEICLYNYKREKRMPAETAVAAWSVARGESMTDALSEIASAVSVEDVANWIGECFTKTAAAPPYSIVCKPGGMKSDYICINISINGSDTMITHSGAAFNVPAGEHPLILASPPPLEGRDYVGAVTVYAYCGYEIKNNAVTFTVCELTNIFTSWAVDFVYNIQKGCAQNVKYCRSLAKRIIKTVWGDTPVAKNVAQYA